MGKTSISELVAVLDMASVVIAPDTGPAHIASALGTPVIGLYAATNPLRAGPYRFKQYVVNKYPLALEKYYQLSVGDAPWGQRVHEEGCMAMISPQDVIEKLCRVKEESGVRGEGKKTAVGLIKRNPTKLLRQSPLVMAAWQTKSSGGKRVPHSLPLTPYTQPAKPLV